MDKETVSVKVDKAVLDKVRKHVKKTKQNIGGFYDLAALDKIKSDKMTEKIIKSNSQSGKNKM